MTEAAQDEGIAAVNIFPLSIQGNTFCIDRSYPSVFFFIYFYLFFFLHIPMLTYSPSQPGTVNAVTVDWQSNIHYMLCT